MFYVYVHRKSTSGEVFYVGKGKDKRAWDTSDRGSHWDRTAKKHGYTVEIIASGLQEWYAMELEIDMIAYYGRMDLNLGKLINKTDGGDGMSGYIYSEETLSKMKKSSNERWSRQEERDKFSATLIGNKRHLGKKHSEETKQKCRDINLGKKMTDEQRKNMSLAAKNRSEEEKLRISRAASERLKGNQHAKGLIFSEESRMKISIGNKGKVRSEEARANYRAAAKLRAEKRKNSKVST